MQGDGGGEKLANEADPGRQVKAVIKETQQGDKGASNQKAKGDFQPQAQADECRQDADAAAARDRAGVGTTLIGAVNQAEAVSSGSHEPSAAGANEEGREDCRKKNAHW